RLSVPSRLFRLRVVRPLSPRLFILLDLPTPPLCTLSLHDALPISSTSPAAECAVRTCTRSAGATRWCASRRSPGTSSAASSSGRSESTRLNSSHVKSSYAVFCLKKKKNHVYDHIYLFIFFRCPDVI